MALSTLPEHFSGRHVGFMLKSSVFTDKNYDWGKSGIYSIYDTKKVGENVQTYGKG